MTLWSDDPVSDAYRHDMELEEQLEKMPVCCACGEHIQTEYLYDVDGDLYCEDCMNDCRKDPMDYVTDD